MLKLRCLVCSCTSHQSFVFAVVDLELHMREAEKRHKIPLVANITTLVHYILSCLYCICHRLTMELDLGLFGLLCTAVLIC